VNNELQPMVQSALPLQKSAPDRLIIPDRGTAELKAAQITKTSSTQSECSHYQSNEHPLRSHLSGLISNSSLAIVRLISGISHREFIAHDTAEIICSQLFYHAHPDCLHLTKWSFFLRCMRSTNYR
jgi:hypothetical protein